MRLNARARCAFSCFALALGCLIHTSDASSPEQDVRAAVDALDGQLGDNANATAWMKFLQHESLMAELNKGNAADPQTVAAVLSKYQSDTPGLDWPPIVAVRTALSSWSEHLQAEQGPELSQLIESAKQSFRAITPEEVAQAKSNLLVSAGALERMLDSGPTANAKAWKDYLRWEPMMAELQKEDAPDLRVLQSAFMKYYQNEVGLELPPFVAVRKGLLRYMNAAFFVGDEQFADKYRANLDELTKLLSDDAAQPSAETAAKIGQKLGWFERAGQADTVLQSVRVRYWQPNLYAQISQKLVSAGFQDAITETTSVRDNILGTSVTGVATMYGNTDVTLIDDPNRAAIGLNLTGTVVSNNVGVNRRVTIRNHGLTQVSALKHIFVSPTGLSSTGAIARCSTNTAIQGISAGSCLVEAIARRQVGKKKGQAEHIASRHAEERVESRFDIRASDLLSQAEEKFQDKFRKPLLRRDQFPEDMRFSTSGGNLNVVWRQASAAQVAAPVAPPALDGQHDMAVRVHETFVSNFSRALLGGVTLTDERLEKILEDTTGNVPDELKVDQGKEPWSITFSSTDPVSAEFSDAMIRFAIRGRRFTLGEQRFSDTLEMSAVYQLAKTPEGAHLTRQGDVSVDFINVTGTLSPKQIALRTVMRRKFEALFEPEFQTDGLTLPGRWKDAGKLQLTQMLSKERWLTLGWLKPTVTGPQTAQVSP